MTSAHSSRERESARRRPERGARPFPHIELACPEIAVFAPRRDPSGRIVDFDVLASSQDSRLVESSRGTQPAGKGPGTAGGGEIDPAIRSLLTEHLQSGRTFSRHELRSEPESRIFRCQLVTAADRVVCFKREATAEVAAARALEQREELLARAQELAQMGYWWRDPVTGRTFWSDHLYRMCGISPEIEVTFDRLLSLAHADDRPRIERAWSRCITAGRGIDLEYRLLAPDGRQRILRGVGVPRLDAEGRVTEVYGVTLDVTAQRATEAALRANAERLSFALDATDEGVWDWNLATGELFQSPRWATMLGYQPGEIEGTIAAWEQICHPDDLPVVQQALSEHFAARTSAYDLVHRLRHRDGHWVWVRGRAKVVERAANAEPLRVVGTNTDVTNLRALEDDLRGAAHAAAQTARLAQIAGVRILADDRVSAPVEFAGLFDIAPETTAELRNLFVPPHRERFDQAILQARRGEPWDFEAELCTPTGRSRWVRTIGEPSPGRDGATPDVRAVIQDVTTYRADREERAALFDLSPDVIAVVDGEGRLRRVNPAYERLVGRTEADLVSAGPMTALHPDERERVARSNRARRPGQVTRDLELRMLDVDGGEHLVSWTSQVGAGPDALIYAVGRDVTQERAAEIERRTLALVAEHTADAIFLLDAAHRIRWINAGFATLTGYGSDEAVGQDLTTLLGPSSTCTNQAAPSPRPQAAAPSLGARDVEIRRRDGRHVWVDLEISTLPSPLGPASAVGVARDVTARRDAEQELRASEERFRTIADAAPVMIWLTDAYGACVDVNHAALTFKGTTREAELRDGWLVGVHPDDRRPLEESFTRAVDEQLGYEHEYRLHHANGTYRWVRDHAVPRRRDDGAFLGLVGVTTDITEQKEAVAREWQASFDAVDSMMLITSRDGRIENVNRSAQAELGERAVGRCLVELAAHEPWRTIARLFDSASEQTGSVTGESREGNGGRSWAIDMSPLEDGNHYVVLVRDVTHVVALQEQLARHERLSAMGQLVAGVAHEVRNPLFALSAGIDALEAELPAELGEFGAMFRREIDRMSRFMQDLLDFGRGPLELPKQRSDLRPLISAAIEQCAQVLRVHQATCRLLAPASLPKVAIDGARCETMIRNLVDNAARHSPPGGDIVLILGVIEHPLRGRFLELTVRDFGPGFPVDDLPRLGQPFFSRRRGGTGLGLAIVARVIADHDGTLGFENLGDGGLVRVRLPLPSD